MRETQLEQDWMRIFAEKFSCHPEVGTLHQRRFHGSLTINFSDGVPHTFKIEQYFKPKKTNLNHGRPDERNTDYCRR